MKKDYYEVLGIARSASAQEIKSAYRKLAVKYHPDRNEGDKESEERFKEVAEAYSVLSDPSKKDKYDRFGHSGLSQGDISYDMNDMFSGISDVFEAFFGGGDPFRRSGRRRYTKGRDLQYELKISFDEAFRGTEKTIRIERHEHCETCEGSGLKPGTRKTTCPVCRGRGQIAYQQGFFTMSRTCTNCHGEGEIVTDPCESCKGKGVELKENEVTIKIPAGINNGDTLRVTDRGEAGSNGGPYGDLYVVVSVKKHKVFVREGQDVMLEIPVSFAQAALGFERDIPTPSGDTRFTVKGGVQSGETFELKGEGFPHINSSRKGSLFVKVNVKTPKKVSGDTKKLFEQLLKLEEEEHESVWEKFKGMFAANDV